MREESKVRVKQDNTTDSPVILALRQYPQGGDVATSLRTKSAIQRGGRAGLTTIQHNHQYPLSLDGRGIKGEGDSKTTQPTASSYWLQGSIHSAGHDDPVIAGLDPQSRGAVVKGGNIPNDAPASSKSPSPSFPRRRAVHGTRTIRRLRLSTESRESRRDSSETRQSTGRPDSSF